MINGKLENEKEICFVVFDEFRINMGTDSMSEEEKFERIKGRILVMSVIGHDFVKQNNNEFAAQILKFSNALNGSTGPTALADKYSYTTAQLLSIKNDAAYFGYWNLKHDVGTDYAKAWTDKGKEIRKGTGTSVTAWPMGDPLTLPTVPPTAVLPGIDHRFRLMANWAKKQEDIYSVGDGITMGIEVNSTPFVPSAGKPDLTVELSDGGHPLIAATKSGYTGFNIYKNSNDGKGFVFLYKCNDPSCSDMTALPALNVTAAWTYKAMYVFGAEEVGTMSDPVTVSVIGTV